MRHFRPVAIAALLTAAACSAPASDATAKDSAAKPGNPIAAAVAAPTRTPANLARDKYRHPAETLAFFGVTPGDTVVELWPGGGWYTEILAPLSNSGGGTLYAAAPWAKGLGRIKEWQGAKPDVYGAIKLAEFPATGAGPKVPDASADFVLTFRNVHNWRFGGKDNTAGSIYGDLLTNTLADQLTAGQGFGFARLVERQLAPHGAAAAAVPSAPTAPSL